MAIKKVILPGSARKAVGNPVGSQPGDEVIEVSVILKPKVRPKGADPAVVEKLREFAKENGLTVGEVSLVRRTVKISGTAAQLTSAFNVQLSQHEIDGHTYRVRTNSIHVPEDIADSIEAVLGLDNRPQARAHFRVSSKPDKASAAAISYTPPQVAALYQFPTGVNGAGQTVGIIELGGGYKPADLKNYFAGLKIAEPKVTAVLVDKAKNAPTNANSADGEVLLDIEVVGSVAPGAHVVVYFTPNTDQGFQDALTTAIHDTTNKPSVISISWGGPESTWTAQAMTAFDSAAQDAAALGVTICAASGDSGSSDGVTDGASHVDFPASSPHILACGGTSLQSSGAAITSETVWNDGATGGAGGGGYSVQFPLPSWQKAGSGRGVPDVSGDADPETGYQVLVDGQSMVIGGTSAVAPLWSGLIALLNESLGKPLGFLQPTLYGLPASSGAIRDVTQGSNGAYSAGPGWDPASGLGSPNGVKLLAALKGTGTSKKPVTEK